MSTKQIFIILSLFILALGIAACGPTTQAAASDHASVNVDEHHGEEADHDHEEAVPAEFEGLTNPLSGEAAAITAGQTIFEANCATCHGADGHGDGPAAANLDPKPASLADAHMMHEMTDGSLYWRISEGGQMEPFNSAMPVWKGSLSDQQIWQVISYIRTLSNEAAGGDEHSEDHAD